MSENRQEVERNLLLAVTFEGEENSYSVSERMSHYNVPGLSFALIRDGQIEWAAGYGVKEMDRSDPVSQETLFQAASIAKAGVAVAAMRMRDAGLIDLDADIHTYLEDYFIPEGEQSAANPVTFRNLLSHTAGASPGGFPGYARGEPYPTALQIVTGLPPANSPAVSITATPGTRMAYSGGGYTILQVAMQDITGASFDRVMDDWLLSPFGMRHSTYSLTLPGELEDRVASGHLADGTVESCQLVSVEGGEGGQSPALSS